MGIEESNGGRPARVYQYNMNFSYIACIIVKAGINARSLAFTVVNLDGKTMEEGYEEKNDLMDAGLSISWLISSSGQFPQIRAVGIGVPGSVNQGAINGSDIPELVNVPLEALIREKHGIEVIMENDMNLTVYGFYQKQEYDKEKSIAVATFIEGSFPGAGMMVNGQNS